MKSDNFSYVSSLKSKQTIKCWAFLKSKFINTICKHISLLHYHDMPIFKYIHKLPQYSKISSSKQDINGPQMYDWTCLIHCKYQADWLQNYKTYPIQTRQSSYHRIPLKSHVTISHNYQQNGTINQAHQSRYKLQI